VSSSLLFSAGHGDTATRNAVGSRPGMVLVVSAASTAHAPAANAALVRSTTARPVASASVQPASVCARPSRFTSSIHSG
jgi:hypothetical protein